MEIIVEGRGIDYISPDQVIINFNFVSYGKNYNEVLEIGCKNVIYFINDVLVKNNFKDDDLKTRNFVIREETKYNEDTRKYDVDGYSFNQNAVLKFDYDKDKLSFIVDSISKLDEFVKYQINFGIKNEKKHKKKIVKIAYNDALEQAKAISLAAGVNLGECVKVSFEPFTNSFISDSKLNTEFVHAKCSNLEVNNILAKTFTPEDIELNCHLYCLWYAE